MVPRQMLALKALLADLVTSCENLSDFVELLLRNTIAPDGSAAFSKDTLQHVSELIVRPAKDEYGMCPKTDGGFAISAFLQDLGHVAEGPRSADPADPLLLVDQALEVVTLLSLRWFAMSNHMCLPEMSDYQRQRWLPPAFSHLVGQILWRHRSASPLQSEHAPVVENLRWIATSPGAEEDMIDRCNAVFKVLSGSSSPYMRLAQWRKVIELLAMKPDLRVRCRRCDAVKACYADTGHHSDDGFLSRKQFKLMLLKTADLMAVHPVVLFQDLASHDEELEKPSATKYARDGVATPEPIM